MDDSVLFALDDARDVAGIPFKVTSGCRCASHNLDEGGRKNSSHTKGLAVDIAADNSRARWLILDAMIKCGFKRIGIAKTFIHADKDKTKSAEVVWLY
jgi:hypothetical protein